MERQLRSHPSNAGKEKIADGTVAGGRVGRWWWVLQAERQSVKVLEQVTTREAVEQLAVMEVENSLTLEGTVHFFLFFLSNGSNHYCLLLLFLGKCSNLLTCSFSLCVFCALLHKSIAHFRAVTVNHCYPDYKSLNTLFPNAFSVTKAFLN